MKEHYPFKLIELPYEYSALEPYIDEETMRLHHDKHLKTYVDKLNETLEPYEKYHKFSLETLLCNLDKLPEQIRTAVKNNGGGVFNHNLFFSILGRTGAKTPYGNVEKAINESFKSYEGFVQKLKESAQNRFGSGYAWLSTNKNKKLEIISTPNQDTVLMLGMYPVLLIDVWEHAYYLKYQNRRPKYIDNFFNVINWDEVEKNYNNSIDYFNKIFNEK